MDVMQLRRGLMMQMAGNNLPNGWKSTTITIKNTASNAGYAYLTLMSELPECSWCVGVLISDYTQEPSENNLLTSFEFCNDYDKNNYIRYRNGAFNGQNTWGASYDLIIPQNTQYFVLYIPS